MFVHFERDGSGWGNQMRAATWALSIALFKRWRFVTAHHDQVCKASRFVSSRDLFDQYASSVQRSISVARSFVRSHRDRASALG